MKKRILCAILSLIMLLSLVPAGALSASAAGKSASANAITILKTLETYEKTCNNGVIGYGLPCDVDHSKLSGAHTTNELEADKALRAKVKELDTAVNGMNVSLTQGQHDALVLFSYDNGTAWMQGTGDYKSAVVSGASGNAFLNAAINWHSSDDNNRRLVEANMYLNGQYSSTAPSSFVFVDFEANNGKAADSGRYYYDSSKPVTIDRTPTRAGYTFKGWYTASGVWVTTLNSDVKGKELHGHWQSTTSPKEENVSYKLNINQFTSRQPLVDHNDKAKAEGKAIKAGTVVTIVKDFIDSNGARWCQIKDRGWVKFGKTEISTEDGSSIDVIVTVTNTYVRSRKENNIYSQQNGTYYAGDKLRIIQTANSKYDNFLWGQVAKSETDDTPIGWVALMYTNFDALKNQEDSAVSTSDVIARATINVNGYVNVRSDAGTNYRIVGALANKTIVDLYETKFVNSHEWGRCSTGWFCLDYAVVTRLTETDSSKDPGVVSYAVTGKTNNSVKPGTAAGAYGTDTTLASGKKVVMSSLTDMNGEIWGKAFWTVETTKNNKKVEVTKAGWIKLSDIDMDLAKFTVAVDSLTVRDIADVAGTVVDNLSKGTEIGVNAFVMNNGTVWGKSYDRNKQYMGWVDLASKNVTRINAPTIPTVTPADKESAPAYTGLIATVINTDNVNVREHSAATYKLIGTLPYGVTVAVWEEDNDWYKIDSNRNNKYDYKGDGWVSGKYLNVREGTIGGNDTTDNGGDNTTTGSSSKTGLGIVSNTYSGVNVRANPGTGSALVGKIPAGTTIEIYETTRVGTSDWGRTDEGWVCMDYIQMLGDLPQDIIDSILGGDGGNGGDSTVVTSSIYAGYISSNTDVNVYKEVGKTADIEIVRTLSKDDPITLHEIRVVTTEEPETTIQNEDGTVTTTYKKVSTNWGRVNDGWVKSPELCIELNALNEITYTVTGVDTLNVRVGAGVDKNLLTDANGDKITLKKGDQVVITDLAIAYDGTVWGHIEAMNGWASLAYMTEGALTLSQIPVEKPEDTTPSAPTTPVAPTVPSTGYRYTGKVIRTTSLNVRALASQSATKTTTLSGGDALVIYETVLSEGMAWGRCDAGWVYLYYVDLVPCNSAVDAKVVYTEGAIAYTDATGSEVAGTYSRMTVVDIYEVVGNRARTELGWVNVDNLG